MATTTSDNETASSITLSLETLTKEYNNILNTYSQVQTDYSNFLISQKKTPNTVTLVSIPSSQYLRSGKSPVVASTENNFAIIPQEQEYLNILTKLNIQLTEINTKILNTISDAEPLYNSLTTESQQQNQTLLNKYKKLTKEREEIDAYLNNTNVTLQQEEDYTSLIVNSNYLKFSLLFILVVIFVIILMNIGVSSAMSSNTYSTFSG